MRMITPSLGRPLATILALGLLLPSVAMSDTLAGALSGAYDHSGLLDQNRALLRAADEDVAAATAALRPVLSYSLSSNYSTLSASTSSNLSLTASLVLFDFGAGQLRRDLARENVMSLRAALRGVEQNVLLGAVVAYTSMQRDGAIVELRTNNVRVIERELQAARDRFEVGEITRTDVALAEARLASARAALAAARGDLDRSREDYRASVGTYPGSLSALPPAPEVPNSLDAARALARQRHPDMAQAQRAVTVAEMNVALAEAALKPVLSGSASAGLDQDSTSSASLGLTFSGAIYRGGALASALRKAITQRDASRASLHIVRHDIDRNLGNAWSGLTVAEASLQASQEQVRASGVAFRGVREETALGARTILDVLNAEQELLDAETARLSAGSDRYVAVYSLLAAMGLLNVKHLGLAVATYDPGAYYDAARSAPVHKISPQGKKLDHILKALGKQ